MLRRVIAPLLLLSLALLAATPTPDPDTVRPEPLVPVNPDAIAEMYSDQVVEAPNGSRRAVGQLVLIANRAFQTASLRSLSPSVALIFEDPPDPRGERIILARVPDQDLDDVIATLRSTPGVMAADKNGILHASGVLEPNDPAWPSQMASGLGPMSFSAAGYVTSALAPVRVAILDTGITPVVDLYPQVDPGYDAFYEGSDTTDWYPKSHGTSVVFLNHS